MNGSIPTGHSWSSFRREGMPRRSAEHGVHCWAFVEDFVQMLEIWSVSAISIMETKPRRKNSCLTACRPFTIPKRSFFVER